MRRAPTLAEQMLWQELRANRLGVRFRAQYVVGPYIPDFVCLHLRLIVEVDGGVHHTPNARRHDAQRTLDLEGLGYTVIRFDNQQVFDDVDAVAEAIRGHVTELSRGQTPSS